jgi:glycosyltransferase involved in cell wall biosynthesis
MTPCFRSVVSRGSNWSSLELDEAVLSTNQSMLRSKKCVLIAHPGRQHSHQAALALHRAGLLGCYATGVPISRNQLSKPWTRLVRRFSVYDEVDIPLSQARLNMVAPAVNRLFVRHLPELMIGPIRYETYRIFDRWVAGLLFRHRFDAVIAYENSAWHTFRAAKEAGVKCILDAASLHHTDQDRFYTSGLPRRYKARVDRLKDAEITLADCIFVTSDFAFKSYVSNVDDKKNLRVIPLGADVDHFKPSTDEDDNRKSPLNFIFIGSATAQKGFDDVLEAMEKLLLEGFTFKLRVVGVIDQSLLAKRRRLREGIVEFGMVGHDKLPSILRGSDCLLLPSRFDSFGMVVVEAMACGVPVIVSDTVGAKQLVEEGGNGFIVPVGCSDTLVDRMRWFILNSDRLKGMSTAARATAEHVSWEKYRERFTAAVREVLN